MADTATIGSGILAGYNNIFQIQRIRNEQTINTNRWSLEFAGLKSILNRAATSPLPAVRARYNACKTAFMFTNDEKNTANDVEMMLQLSLFSVTLPSIKLETQDISRFNDSTKAVTKFAPLDDLQVEFWDYVDGSASAIMQVWHSLVGDKATGAIGYKKDFVLQQAFFYVYGPDAPGYDGTGVDMNGKAMTVNGDAGKIPYLQKYEVWNLFPTGVELGQHSDNGEARKVNCTFACDNIFPVDIQSYNSGQPGENGNYLNYGKNGVPE